MIVMNNKMLVKLNKQTINYPRLNKKLSKILDEGVIWVNNCYILQYFYKVNQHYSLENFEDYTAYECFMNGFHVEDYCVGNTIQYAFSFTNKLARILQGKCKFKIILSVNNQNYCHITFHSLHNEETEWVVMEQLDSYSESIAVFM